MILPEGLAQFCFKSVLTAPAQARLCAESSPALLLLDRSCPARQVSSAERCSQAQAVRYNHDRLISSPTATSCCVPTAF